MDTEIELSGQETAEIHAAHVAAERATALRVKIMRRLATAHGLDPDAQRLELDLLRGVIRVLPAAPDPEPAP